MEISGKIIQSLPEQSGNGRNGVWKKKDYILETEGNYPKKVCITVWGEKIEQFNMQEGDQVNLGIEIESREFNGKWYTDVKAWKLDKASGSSSSSSTKVGGHSLTPDVSTFSEESGDDILPF
jgi:hypothetical protein